MLAICLEKIILDRGAKVTAQLTGTHYRRSPLFQGGLEIPCLVTATIPGSICSFVDSELSANDRGTVLCSERRLCAPCLWEVF